jgi:TonB-dependent starch-binding outer membrane protein SusC
MKKQINYAMRHFVSFRLFALLLCFFSAAMTFTTSAQESKITLKFKKVTLSEVLNQIEKKSSYSFLVRSSDVNLKEVVSIDVENKSVEDILTQLFDQSQISFEITGKSISIFKLQNNSNSPKELKKVSGIVTDQNGVPIIGASIIEKGSKKGTITDVNGKFTLDNINSPATLTVSYIGYLSKTIDVGAKTRIDVILAEDSKALDEKR